ncbi:TonB family protein [Klebsiella pneumoniae]
MNSAIAEGGDPKPCKAAISAVTHAKIPPAPDENTWQIFKNALWISDHESFYSDSAGGHVPHSGTCDTTKPVTTLQPTYPVQAAAKRIEGQVTATFDILDDGRVDNVSLTGCHLFRNADGNEALAISRRAPGNATGYKF